MVGGGSNPGWVSAGLYLELQKRVYIFDKETAATRSPVVLGDVVFLHLINFDDFVPLLHGHSHLVDDPRTRESPLGDHLVRALVLCVLLDGARLT